MRKNGVSASTAALDRAESNLIQAAGHVALIRHQRLIREKIDAGSFYAAERLLSEADRLIDCAEQHAREERIQAYPTEEKI